MLLIVSDIRNYLERDRSPEVAGCQCTVYIGVDDGTLHAVNPDGTPKWVYTTGGVIRSAPAIAPDGTIFVGSHDYKLHAIHPDGSPYWTYTTGDILFSSPAIAFDGTVYVGSSDDNLYAVHPDGSLWGESLGHGL